MWIVRLKNNRVINNATWIVACKVIQALLAFIINMITARYLGPSNFGLISYAASIVAFVVPIMRLGIDSILVQEIINCQGNEDEIIGTSVVINFFMSIVCIMGIILFTYFMNAGEKDTLIVCTLYSVILLFQSIEIIQYWFQAKLLSKYTSMVMLTAYILVSIYKIYILVSNKSVYWFAISNAIDYFIIAISLIVIYYKISDNKLKYSHIVAKKLIGKGRYFIVANLMVTIFVQADRIMLKTFIGNEEVGIYAAAYTCAGATAFIFSAIIDSARPIIFESKKSNQKIFENNVISLYSIVIYLSLSQCIVMTLFANFIIITLYGIDYFASAVTLQVLVWYTTFSYMGTVRNIWMIAEEKQNIIWVLNLVGVVVNIVLNFYFIPILQSVGAALASLVTQFITNVIMGFVIKDIRYNNYLMLKAFNPKYIYNLVKRL